MSNNINSMKTINSNNNFKDMVIMIMISMKEDKVNNSTINIMEEDNNNIIMITLDINKIMSIRKKKLILMKGLEDKEVSFLNNKFNSNYFY